MKRVGIEFNVLIKKEEDLFVAHCLELDIVTTAHLLKEVQEDIIDLIIAQVDYAFCYDNLENLYHPAPPEVWREFFACKDARTKKRDVKSAYNEEPGIVPPYIAARMCQALSPRHV